MNQRHRGYKTPGMFSGCLPWLVGGAMIALAVYWLIAANQ